MNGDKSDVTPAPRYEDEGELGQLKKQYASKLSTVKEMFPDWTDEDVVFALQETDGDLESTIERISEGVSTYFVSSLVPWWLRPTTDALGFDRQYLTVGRGQEED